MRVSATFGITSQVPFVDVHLERDNELFLDPSAIRNNTDALSRRAQGNLVSFFGEVLRCRRSTSALDQARGLALLQELHEPNETRLGMSARGVRGHGWGPEMGQRLWDELATNRACQAAALTRLEDLALFIDRVGDDLVSDMTTRVIFDVLVDFTHQVMATFPAIGRSQVTVNSRTWDPTALHWVPVAASLPDIPPHPLLLIPKGWVFWRLLMDYGAFYNRFATTTVQEERTKLDERTGRLIRPSKRQLNSEFPDLKSLNTVQAAKKMDDQHRDLVAEYRAQVDSEFEPLSDAELDRRTD